MKKNTVNAFGNEFAKLSFHVSLLHTNEHIHVSQPNKRQKKKTSNYMNDEERNRIRI